MAGLSEADFAFAIRGLHRKQRLRAQPLLRAAANNHYSHKRAILHRQTRKLLTVFFGGA
jgi:hypothetical protein